jgi:SAM-dependent methyltransferase
MVVPPWRADWLTVRALRRALQAAARDAMAAAGIAEAARPLVLDLGCGERPWAGLFDRAQCIGVDISVDGASPDVVAEGSALPFADASFDIVFCSQVLEHVADDKRVLAECARTLRPAGRLVLSVPFYWPLHEEPHDYRRFTCHGLHHALREAGFDRIEIAADTGSVTMVAVAALELLPRRRGAWLILAPLVLAVNAVAWLLQCLSSDRRSPLNWIVSAQRN